MVIRFELPKECQSLVDELKKKGFIVTRAYYNEVVGACVVDFIDPYTNSRLKQIEGVVPFAWYTSSIEYLIDENKISFNFNRIPEEDKFELYIPDECNEEGKCRIHIYFNPEVPKIGFEGKEFSVEKAKKFLEQFFILR